MQAICIPHLREQVRVLLVEDHKGIGQLDLGWSIVIFPPSSQLSCDFTWFANSDRAFGLTAHRRTSHLTRNSRTFETPHAPVHGQRILASSPVTRVVARPSDISVVGKDSCRKEVARKTRFGMLYLLVKFICIGRVSSLAQKDLVPDTSRGRQHDKF